jgi:hypothetical protein
MTMDPILQNHDFDSVLGSSRGHKQDSQFEAEHKLLYENDAATSESLVSEIALDGPERVLRMMNGRAVFTMQGWAVSNMEEVLRALADCTLSNSEIGFVDNFFRFVQDITCAPQYGFQWYNRLRQDRIRIISRALEAGTCFSQKTMMDLFVPITAEALHANLLAISQAVELADISSCIMAYMNQHLKAESNHILARYELASPLNTFDLWVESAAPHQEGEQRLSQAGRMVAITDKQRHMNSLLEPLWEAASYELYASYMKSLTEDATPPSGDEVSAILAKFF